MTAERATNDTPETMAKGEFAAHLGVTAARVSQLVAAGRLVLTEDGRRVRVAESVERIRATEDPAKVGVKARWADHRAEQGKPATGPLSGPVVDLEGYALARTMNQREKARAALVEAAGLARTLAPRVEASGAAAALGEEARSVLDRVAAEAAPAVAAATDGAEVYRLLNAALRGACGELSGGEVGADETASPDDEGAGVDASAIDARVEGLDYRAAAAVWEEQRGFITRCTTDLKLRQLRETKQIRRVGSSRALAGREALLSIPDRLSAELAAVADPERALGVLQREIRHVTRGWPRARVEEPYRGAEGLASGAGEYEAAWRAGWRVPPALKVWEWADRYRILPRKGAAEPGPWRTARAPYQREIMECLSAEHPCKEVVFMKSTQVGATDIGVNWQGYVMDHAPGPMLVVQPSLDMAKKYSTQRVQPTIEESPRLRALVGEQKSRDAANTMLLKDFPGGVLVISGANSAASLRSMPIRYLHLDEVDAYDRDLDDEGAPDKLAERRTSTFARRKIFRSSTPTIKDVSAIEAAYARSDQRHYHVPCPHCGGYQVLRDEQLTDDGRYLCECCGELIGEHEKGWMLEEGVWVAANPASDVPGFHVNAIYTPLGLGYTWKEIVAEREEARGDPVKWKVYTNTLLGLPYEDPEGKLDHRDLAARAEDYPLRVVPRGGLVITGFVDVQISYVEVVLIAWGRGMRGHVVDHVRLPGSPVEEETWKELDAFLARPLVNTYGREMKPAAIGVDSGNWTQQVYQFTRPRRMRRILATKGMPQAHKSVIGRPSYQDVSTSGGVLKGGVQLWPVGTIAAKDTVFGWLSGDADKDPEDRHLRFSTELEDDFFRQLTAERYDPERKRYMKLPGRRNEVLDCVVGCLAMAHHPELRLHLMREPDWAKLERIYEPANGDLFADTMGTLTEALKLSRDGDQAGAAQVLKDLRASAKAEVSQETETPRPAVPVEAQPPAAPKKSPTKKRRATRPKRRGFVGRY